MTLHMKEATCELRNVAQLNTRVRSSQSCSTLHPFCNVNEECKLFIHQWGCSSTLKHGEGGLEALFKIISKLNNFRFEDLLGNKIWLLRERLLKR